MRPYDVQQRYYRRLFRREDTQHSAVAVKRHFVAEGVRNWLRALLQGLREGTALYFLPLISLHRMIKRCLRRRRNE